MPLSLLLDIDLHCQSTQACQIDWRIHFGPVCTSVQSPRKYVSSHNLFVIRGNLVGFTPVVVCVYSKGYESNSLYSRSKHNKHHLGTTQSSYENLHQRIIGISIFKEFATLIFLFQIRDKCRELILDNDKLRKIMEIFLDNVHRGLKKNTHADSVVKCFPTYVQDLPNGTGKIGTSYIKTFLSQTNWNADSLIWWCLKYL